METTVIIYGPAAAPTAKTPKKIDVAYTGDKRAAEGIAKEWAKKQGVRSPHLKLVCFRVVGGRVTLPAPPIGPSHARVITGNAVVEWAQTRTLAEAARVYGEDPEELQRVLKAGGPWPLTIIGGRDGGSSLDALRKALDPDPGPVWVLIDLWPLMKWLLVSGPRPSSEGLETLKACSSGGRDEVVVHFEVGTRDPYLPGGRGKDMTSLLYPLGFPLR